jgi:hypothetical protein
MPSKAGIPSDLAFAPDQISYGAILRKYKIPNEFHADFQSFMQTGRASTSFVRFLDETERCQLAVEEVLAQHLKTLRPLLQVFEEAQPEQGIPSPLPRPSAIASAESSAGN